MFLSYDREADVDWENPDLRVTFDNHIRWRQKCLRLEDGIDGGELLKKGQYLMERKVSSVFLAMAVGLAGYVGIAAVLTVIVGLMRALYTATGFGESKIADKELVGTIPENLDDTGIFDDLFGEYTDNNDLVRVKTSMLVIFGSSIAGGMESGPPSGGAPQTA